MATKVGVLPGDAPLQGTRGDKWGPISFTPRTTLDLSGRTWIAQIRTTKDEPAEVLATFTVDSSDSADGVIRLVLPPDESANLVTGSAAGFPAGKATYYYDVQGTVISDVTDVRTWFAGKVYVNGDVSLES